MKKYVYWGRLRKKYIDYENYGSYGLWLKFVIIIVNEEFGVLVDVIGGGFWYYWG